MAGIHKIANLGRSGKDALIVIAGALLAYACSLTFNLSEEINASLASYEYIQLDEIPLTLFVFALLSVWFSQRRMREIHTEIQRRKLTETQLISSQQLFKTLFDGDLTGNVVLDIQGNIGMHNSAFDRICGPITPEHKTTGLFSFDWPAFVVQLQQDREINFNKIKVHRLDGLPCYVSARFIYVPENENFQKIDGPAQIHGYLVDITEQCAIEVDLERLLKENRVLAHHAMQVQEQERKYIAREIHDETGQYLTAIRMDALALQKSEPDQIHTIASRLASNTQHVQQSIRALIKNLRPLALDSLGLIGAVEQLVSDWKKLNPLMSCHLQLDISGYRLNEDINIVAFRVVQEALTNITRHAHASEVSINIQVINQETAPILQIEVIDNGKGMDSAQSTEGIGLVGMRERLESLQGIFKISGGINTGTVIKGLIPLGNDLSTSMNNPSSH